MYSTAFSLPVVALVAGTLALSSPATAAHATESTSSGNATAVVLRAGLDVSQLLGKTGDVPLNVSLNDVHAPASAQKTLLTAELDGVDHGKPFTVLQADVATARATAEARKTEGYVRLVDARVHVPGLPGLGLVKARTVTSKATCETGEQPTAQSRLAGLLVLGKHVAVGAGGTTKVEVPGVGEVKLELSERAVTSRTAAATALELTVSVKPHNLNVAEVTGQVTLAKATCESPQGGSSSGGSGSDTGGYTGGSDTGSDNGTGTGSDTGTGTGPGADAGTTVQTAGESLAETGGSSATPYLVAGAAALLTTGGAVVFAARRRKQATVNVRD